MKKKTKITAVCGVISALEIALLYIGSITDIMDLTFGAVASLITAVIVIEAGGAAPYFVYGVTSVISLLMLPNKFIGVVYLLFFGFYPMIKAVFERIHYALGWILKLSVFNTVLLIIIVLSEKFFMAEDISLTFEVATILLANAAFVLYDICFTKLITLYLVKIRARLGLKNYFEN